MNIPTEGRQGRLRIVNIYIPPFRENRAQREREVVEDLKRLPKGRNVIWCGDFNAHHPQWDPNREEDDMGERLVELFLEEGLTTVNNGEATWYARRDEGSPRTAPDITVEWASEDMTTEWSVLHRLSSDHLPISIEWKKEYEREKKEREVRPNLAKVDWQKYMNTLEGKMTEIGEIRNPKAKYAALEKEILEAAREATPKKYEEREKRSG